MIRTIRQVLARAALTLAGVSLAAPAALAARAYVVESDFSAGSFSSVHASTKAPSCNVSSAHYDARVRWYDGRVYIVNRLGADNITVLDGATYALVKQFSVGNGANPYDIAFASPTKAYVTRYESADLWIVDPTTGAHTGTISLAAFVDDDGIPEMDRLIMVGPLLFVSLQRVDRNNFFQPTDPALVAVIDTRTDTLVDCDPGTAGMQAIVLPRTNPVTPFVFDQPRTRLYLGCAGFYGALDGGIVSIDPANLVADGIAAPEDSLGGDVLDLAWGGDDKAYAIVSDAGFNTKLIHWSPSIPRFRGTLYNPGGFSLSDAEVTPDGSEVWVGNSSFGSPGIRVFSTATDLPVGGAITCTLPPQGITFDAATGQVAGVNTPAPRLGLAPIHPNPARERATLAWWSDGPGELAIQVVDVAGRSVARWTRVPTAAGAGSVDWDLRDASGRSVPPGLYLASVRGPRGVASRPILVVR